MSDKIYHYMYCDAWGKPKEQIEIYDNDTFNYRELSSFNGNNTRSLNRRIIEKIKGVIRRHEVVFEFDELESPPILDGYLYKFIISLDGKSKSLTGYNIWAFAGEHPEKELGEMPVKALEVMSLHLEIMNSIGKNELKGEAGSFLAEALNLFARKNNLIANRFWAFNRNHICNAYPEGRINEFNLRGNLEYPFKSWKVRRYCWQNKELLKKMFEECYPLLKEDAALCETMELGDRITREYPDIEPVDSNCPSEQWRQTLYKKLMSFNTDSRLINEVFSHIFTENMACKLICRVKRDIDEWNKDLPEEMKSEEDANDYYHKAKYVFEEYVSAAIETENNNT